MFEKLYADIEKSNEETASLLLEMMKFDSTSLKDVSDEYPYGKGVAECLQFTLDYCEKLGFKTFNYGNKYGYAEIGDSEDYVASINHLDIVPFGDLSKWNYNVLGQREGDKIYGRGAVDNKGPAACVIQALHHLVKSGLLKANSHGVQARIRLVFGTNEESGMADIIEYAKKERTPKFAFSPDAGWPCCYAEKGVLRYSINGKIDDAVVKYIEKLDSAVNIIPGTCTAILKNVDFAQLEAVAKKSFSTDGNEVKLEKLSDGTCKVVAIGRSGHAAAPEEPANAINIFFRFVKESVGDKSELANFYIDNFVDYYGVALGTASEDFSGKLTNCLNLISYENGEFTSSVDCRYPVTVSFENDIYVKLANKIGKTPWAKLNVWSQSNGHQVDLNSPIVKIITETYDTLSGTKSQPYSMGGGTYARRIPGAVAVGTSFLPSGGAHQENEYINVDGMIGNTKMYATLFYKFAQLIEK